jgi:hypothetical protein
MRHTTYSAIIEGSVHTQDEVIAWANGMVWGEINTTDNQYIKHSRYVTTVQGDVGVWYDYAYDHYFFTVEPK